jgi:hypothetical protein
MGLYEDLIGSVKDKGDEVIKDVRVGTTWTTIKTSKLGLSLTYSSSYDEVEDAGNLIGKRADELLGNLKTFNLLKLSIGLATLNSLLDIPKDFETFNILDYLEEVGKDKKIVFVGHFCGLDNVRKAARELVILERNPQQGDLLDTACEYVVPEAEILAITGSAFANKSIERLLQLSKGYTVVFGPSAPLSPVLFDYRVNLIGGSLIVDEEKVIQAVSQGGKLNSFKKYLKYVAIRRK